MNAFDPVAEIKKYKVHLIAMSVAIFSLTFMLSLCGGEKTTAKRSSGDKTVQRPMPIEGILLDYSDPQLAEDRLRMPLPLMFHTRRLGVSMVNFERTAYVLDDAQFEETYQIYEKRSDEAGK